MVPLCFDSLRFLRGAVYGQAGLFGLPDHPERPGWDSDPPEILEATVEFEYLRE